MWIMKPMLWVNQPHHWWVLASSSVALWHHCEGRSWVVLHAVVRHCPVRPAPELGPPSVAYTGTSRNSLQPTLDCCHLHPGFGLWPRWMQIRKSFLRGKHETVRQMLSCHYGRLYSSILHWYTALVAACFTYYSWSWSNVAEMCMDLQCVCKCRDTMYKTMFLNCKNNNLGLIPCLFQRIDTDKYKWIVLFLAFIK